LTNGDGQITRDELLRGQVVRVQNQIGSLDNTTDVKLNQANANTAAANTLLVSARIRSALESSPYRKARIELATWLHSRCMAAVTAAPKFVH
jgi:hypothetical protein